MSTNGKVSQLFVIILIIVPFVPNYCAAFSPITMLLYILPLLKIFSCFTLNKTKNQ